MTTQTAGNPAAGQKPSTRKRILSGNRPTGPLHLGNYLGAVKNWVQLQDDYDCFFMIADWHALTSDYADTSKLPQNTRAVLLDWIGAGLDPERSIMFIQSMIKEHAELTLLLGMFTPIPWLERTPSFKEQQEQIKEKDLNTYGFLGYPVLQAADIVIYRAHVVPVGEDQLAHLELCREIVRRFHHFYQVDVFPEPQPLLSPVPKLVGIDGRKMSKSYGNAIYLSDPEKEINQKVMQMVTDPQRVKRSDPGHPEVCSVCGYHEVFTPSRVEEIKDDCRNARIGCVDCKKMLARSMNDLLDPMRERRKPYEENPAKLDEIVEHGNAQARTAAGETMHKVREILHLPQ